MNETLKMILTVAISSGIMGCVISFVFSMIQSSKDYKREFLKRFLDKRFESYEKIETILGYFSSVV